MAKTLVRVTARCPVVGRHLPDAEPDRDGRPELRQCHALDISRLLLLGGQVGDRPGGLLHFGARYASIFSVVRRLHLPPLTGLKRCGYIRCDLVAGFIFCPPGAGVPADSLIDALG